MRMSTVLTLELPDDLAARARAVAAASHQPIEQAVVEWIGRAVAEAPVEAMTDPQVLALCDSQLDPSQQEELSESLAKLREGTLDPQQRMRLNELMATYRQGLVLKARAVNEAVKRGLRPSACFGDLERCRVNTASAGVGA
jgi:hypothetical protein